MPLPPPETKEFAEQITVLQSHTKLELEQSQQQLQEIKLLLGQTASEVEKLGQRELALANRVRDMEVNLDSYSRPDIRTLYNTNHEVQLRLFMMRSQSEQLESRQQNIRDYQDKLRTILELLQVQLSLAVPRGDQGVEPATDPNGQDGTAVPAWQSAIAVIEGQEEERLRLAREIQDGPTQAMTNLLLHLEVCRQVLKRDVDGAQRELDGLKGMLSGTLQETRRLLSDIRPIALEDLGLVEMLRRHLNEVGRAAGVETVVDGAGLSTPLPHHLQIALYRLLQGAVATLLAPGEGGRLAITLRADADHAIAQVELDPAGTEAEARLDAYLRNPVLARRVELLEGWAGAEVADGGTLQLTFQFPIRVAVAS